MAKRKWTEYEERDANGHYPADYEWFEFIHVGSRMDDVEIGRRLEDGFYYNTKGRPSDIAYWRTLDVKKAKKMGLEILDQWGNPVK